MVKCMHEDPYITSQNHLFKLHKLAFLALSAGNYGTKGETVDCPTVLRDYESLSFFP